MANKEYDRATIIDKICGLMAEGQSLRRICSSVVGMPKHSTVIMWCNEDKELADQYARARDMLADYRFDEYQDSAAEIVSKYIAEGWEPKDAIAMAKLECGNLQWALSKLLPRKYGDKITQELTGDGGGPLSIEIISFTREK